MDPCNDPTTEEGKGLSPTNGVKTTPRTQAQLTSPETPCHQHSRMPTSGLSDEFEDHMIGSTFAGTDVCMGCGFPRSSSVWCSVTQRHHGTDELSTTHKNTQMGSNFFLRLFRAKKSGERTPNRLETPAANCPSSLKQSLLPAAEEGVNLTPVECDLPLSRASTATGESVDRSAEPGRNGGEPPPLQYYCYTDENGDVFYYATETLDTVPQPSTTVSYVDPNHLSANLPVNNGEATALANTTGIMASDENLAEGTVNYIYEYVDEHGNTQHCMAEVPINATSGAEPRATTPILDNAANSASTSGAAAATDSANSQGDRKSKKSWSSILSVVFKSKRDITRTLPELENAGSTANNCADADSKGHDDDAAVRLHMESLEDPTVRKKFEKEYNKLTKTFLQEEEKMRRRVHKERKESIADLSRERRAAEYVLISDAQKLRKAQKAGEPA